jgi:lipid-binding SYLF domain-containing protein
MNRRPLYARKKRFGVAAWILVAITALTAQPLAAEKKVEHRLREAAAALEESLNKADQSIPGYLLNRAHCIGVFPSVFKVAFILGGRYGKGVVTCRLPDGGWSAPANFRIEAGNIGFQAGGNSTDVILLFMGAPSVNRLMRTNVTLGLDAAAVAGPLGRTGSGQTDALFGAEILGYSMSRGVFLGVAFDGATLRPAHKADRNLYSGVSPRTKEILKGNVEAPAAAQPLLDVLRIHSPQKRVTSD